MRPMLRTEENRSWPNTRFGENRPALIIGEPPGLELALIRQLLVVVGTERCQYQPVEHAFVATLEENSRRSGGQVFVLVIEKWNQDRSGDARLGSSEQCCAATTL